TPLSLELDHYSALFILTALKALAADPGLWNTFVEGPQHDKLLFRREDLDDPARSALIKSLKKSPDAEVARLCQQLIELRQVPIAGVPRLADLLFSFSSVEKLLGAREFDAAIDMLSRAKKTPADAPAALQPKIREAQQRVQQRAELERAVAAGDEAAMQRSFQPKWFEDYPSASRPRRSPRARARCWDCWPSSTTLGGRNPGAHWCKSGTRTGPCSTDGRAPPNSNPRSAPGAKRTGLATPCCPCSSSPFAMPGRFPWPGPSSLR